MNKTKKLIKILIDCKNKKTSRYLTVILTFFKYNFR